MAPGVVAAGHVPTRLVEVAWTIAPLALVVLVASYRALRAGLRGVGRDLVRSDRRG